MDDKQKQKENVMRIFTQLSKSMEGELTGDAVEAILHYLAKVTCTHVSYERIEQQTVMVARRYLQAVEEYKDDMQTETWTHIKN